MELEINSNIIGRTYVGLLLNFVQLSSENQASKIVDIGRNAEA